MQGSLQGFIAAVGRVGRRRKGDQPQNKCRCQGRTRGSESLDSKRFVAACSTTAQRPRASYCCLREQGSQSALPKAEGRLGTMRTAWT